MGIVPSEVQATRLEEMAKHIDLIEQQLWIFGCEVDQETKAMRSVIDDKLYLADTIINRLMGIGQELGNLRKI